ncbi:hypothetical protein BGZ72_010600 [Mortierella alpina]|nr:hypothetical protein BGZ72_010600 [Mortierella alpina]
MQDTRPKSPFDLPELREIIRANLTQKDAIACSRVCRAWLSYFRDLAWHTIDFSTFDQAKLTQEALIKHGQHVCAIQTLHCSSHLSLLMWNPTWTLRSLTATLSAELGYQTAFYDFLRMVRGTLTELDLSVEPPKPTAPLRDRHGYSVSSPAIQSAALAKINVPVDVIIPRGPSLLTKISLKGLQLSRLSLIALLQGCPDLQDLLLYDILLVPSQLSSTQQSYRHPKLRNLLASFHDVVVTGDALGPQPLKLPLLGLFPGLECWTVWGDDAMGQWNLRNLSLWIRLQCPKLRHIQLSTDSTALVKDCVAHVFDKIESLQFQHKALSSEVLIAIVGHVKTLKHIESLPPAGTILYDRASPQTVNDHFSSSGWMLLSIPRLCSHLESFCFPMYRADMDNIESGEWECKRLKEIRIRIAGLDTAEKIDRAIQLWLDGRRNHTPNERPEHLTLPAAFLGIGNSLESRIAAHLLKFKELRTVWLGTKVWRV